MLRAADAKYFGAEQEGGSVTATFERDSPDARFVVLGSRDNTLRSGDVVFFQARDSGGLFLDIDEGRVRTRWNMQGDMQALVIMLVGSRHMDNGTSSAQPNVTIADAFGDSLSSRNRSRSRDPCAAQQEASGAGPGLEVWDELAPRSLAPELAKEACALTEAATRLKEAAAKLTGLTPGPSPVPKEVGPPAAPTAASTITAPLRAALMTPPAGSPLGSGLSPNRSSRAEEDKLFLEWQSELEERYI